MKVFEESHSGWTTHRGMCGDYDILDQNGWALATLHYDYRYTCNATNHHRAALLAAAPELLKALTDILDASNDPYEIARAALARVAGAVGGPAS